MTDTSLTGRAMRLLARREHSRAELARKLAAHGTDEEVGAALDRLSELGLLSDHRFAEAWLRSKASRFGMPRLRRDLIQRGVDPDTIDDAIEAEPLENEYERAGQVWRTRFGTIAGDHKEWARQARFLQGRGFSTDVIRKVLREAPDESA